MPVPITATPSQKIKNRKAWGAHAGYVAFIPLEDLVQRFLQNARYSKGRFEARGVLSLFDRGDGLTRDADFLTKLGLGHFTG